VLSFDLTDATGQVLHNAGLPINDWLKERLWKKNIHSVSCRFDSLFRRGFKSLGYSSKPRHAVATGHSVAATRKS